MQAIDIRQTECVTDELERELRTLTGLQERMRDVYNRLPHAMSNQIICARLKNQIEAVDAERNAYLRLRQALDQILEQYLTTEKRVAEFAEETGNSSDQGDFIRIAEVIVPEWIYTLLISPAKLL